jgi:hypothetical protein
MKSQEPKYFVIGIVQMDEGINNFIENKLKNKITVAFKSWNLNI